MRSTKIWQRAAVAAYIAAAAALPLAGYALATAQTNTNAIADAQRHLTEVRWRDYQAADYRASAASAAGDGMELDSRPYSAAVDWAAVSARIMPSVAMIEILQAPLGDGSHNQAWLVPGVQTNQAVSWLNRYRSWRADWAGRDQIREYTTAGAGFVIGDGRQVVTAAHVVRGIEGVQVKLASGEWRTASVVGVDYARDVALLRIDGDPVPPVKIAPAMPRQGQAIAAVGAPGGRAFTLSSGIVSHYGSSAGMFQPQPMLGIAGPITGGNSGGPVFNSRGEVVGLISFGADGFHEAVPIGRVLEVAGNYETWEK